MYSKIAPNILLTFCTEFIINKNQGILPLEYTAMEKLALILCGIFLYIDN